MVAAALAGGNARADVATGAGRRRPRRSPGGRGLPAGALSRHRPAAMPASPPCSPTAGWRPWRCAAPAGWVAAAGRTMAQRDGPILPLIVYRDRPAATGGIGVPLAGTAAWLERFVHERTLTVDTTASGGNAALLSLDEDA